MKPLTIDEIKSFKVGDWVWLNVTGVSSYAEIEAQSNDRIFLNCKYIYGSNYSYHLYGKTWLAYKNKEQAEAKGEIVELMLKAGDTIYIVDTILNKIDTRTIEFIALREDNITIHTTSGRWMFYDWLGDTIFKTEEEAEHRLAELKGEKE